MEQTKDNVVVLAFDIERSGGRSQDQTIAIGASVVDSNFIQLDSLFTYSYVPGVTTFEERSWSEFWVNNLDVLSQLEYKGPQSMEEREYEMITQFHEFREKWELKTNDKVILCNDNSPFDVHYINELYGKYMPNVLPMPYTAYSQEYSSLFETHSMQKGLLSVVAPEFTSNWGFTDKIKEIYKIPTMPESMTHNHLPHHDAYTIATEMHILLQIQKGDIKLKK